MRTDASPSLEPDSMQRLVDQYADRLALDWRRRGHLLQSSQADVESLRDWDARMDAALDALRLLEPAASEQLEIKLQAPINAGEAFLIQSLALATGNSSLAQSVIALSSGLPHLRAGVVSAMAWAPASDHWHRCIRELDLSSRFDLIAARQPELTDLVAPSLELLHAESPRPLAVLAALRCLRHMGDGRCVAMCAEHLDDADPALRRHAAHGLLVLGPLDLRARAIGSLQQIALQAGPQSMAAVRCLAVLEPLALKQCLPQLMHGAGARCTRLALLAMGWAGDPAAVLTLMEHLDDADTARVAADAVMLLTGLDPVRDGWQAQPRQQPSRPTDDAVTPVLAKPDPDAGLTWPDRAAFERLWVGERKRLVGSTPRIGGVIADEPGLQNILNYGRLAWRPLAAARLQRLKRGALPCTWLPMRVPSAFSTVARSGA